MKDLQRFALLIDFYGSLLTARQRELMGAYYLEDLSLGEIAGEDGVSRQAVHDLIKRSEAALTELEAKLGLVAEYQERTAATKALRSLLERIHARDPHPDLEEAVRLVDRLLEEHA